MMKERLSLNRYQGELEGKQNRGGLFGAEHWQEG